MKKIRNKKQIAIIATTIVVLAGLALASYTYNRPKTALWQGTTPAPSATVIKGNSTSDEPAATPTPKATATPIPSTAPGNTPQPVTLTKPVLQRSSGTLPAGQIEQFTCEGTMNLFCQVSLTDQANPARVITLEKKTIAGNGRGQYFALWDWTAVKGVWTVVATASDAAGNTAVSQSQTVDVK